ncbi:MAG: hypothetical protein WAP35_06060 [Solirubrobacterales bacterium]
MEQSPHNDGYFARNHADCRQFVSKRDHALRDGRTRCGEIRHKRIRRTGGDQLRISRDRRGVQSCQPRF